MRFKSHPRNRNVQLIPRLVGHFFALHGIEKQMCNAFWFVFIRFCFREMSGERCSGWEFLRKMMEATYVGKRRLVEERLRNEVKIYPIHTYITNLT